MEKATLITDSFVSKYDYFKLLTHSEKISRLTHRSLDLLLNEINHQRTSEEKWKSFQVLCAQQGKELPDYNPKEPILNLTRLLYHIRIPSILDDNLSLSTTTQAWANDEAISYPLEGDPTVEQEFVSQLLPKYVKEKTALIGAATWNGNETFYFLRTLANHEKARSFIHYASNIEINPLNVRLAHVVAHELGLDSKRFRTIEGDALTALPKIPEEIGSSQQTIIACRFIPTLTLNEISQLLSQIRRSLSSTRGCAILSYSIVSLIEWENPQSQNIKSLLKLCELKRLRIEEVRGKQGELLGISFINNENNTTFQTLLFQEKTVQFFLEQKIRIIERKVLGLESGYYREVAIIALEV